MTAVPPRPILSQRAEERLGARHREILDQLETLFLEEGFAGWSVRELAGRVGCSRRTLYELAASKDELVVLVLDRFLQRTGRAALDQLRPEHSYAQQIRAYYKGGVELQRMTQVFADDLADDPAVRRVFDRHFGFVMAKTQELVDAGVRDGEFRQVPASIVAGALTSAGSFFGDPADDPSASIDALVDVIVEGIRPR